MNLHVLVVESQAGDTLFLRDVLTELDGDNAWTNWTHLTATYASTWQEAAVVLERDAVDVVLLDLDLRDSQGAMTFRRAQLVAPQVPMILLVEAGSVSLAERFLREGAQDFLVKSQIDCGPMAHAVSGAVARHRLLAATRATSMTDPLTGLLNRTAFFLLADRDRMLADRMDRRMMLIVTVLSHLDDLASAFGEHRRDLELVEAADYLRSLTGPADLTARLDDNSLAICVFETERESMEEVWARMHSATASRRMSLGAAVFDPRRPVTLDALLEQAAQDVNPRVAMAVS